MEKLLSICIPTYNRVELVIQLLDEIFHQLQDIQDDSIEVIVSVNPSETDKGEIIRKRFKNFNYVLIINETNIGLVNNLKQTIKLSSGKMIWIIGDDDIIVPGLIKRVAFSLKEHPDISWIYLNSAGLDGDAASKSTKISDPLASKISSNGYYSNAKELLLKIGPVLNGKLLFSSSNIYLREAALKMIEDNVAEKKEEPFDIYFQLTATMVSSLCGGAYIFNELCIVQGAAVSWSNTSYYVHVHAYNRAILLSSQYGFTKNETKKFVRRRMTNAALYIWVLMVRKTIKKPKEGLKDLKIYFSNFPFLTIIMILFMPIWIWFYLIRGIIKKHIRKKRLKKLQKNKDLLPNCVKERI